jgi:hypothetical protein
MSNTRKKWTQAEDKYLKLSVKEGLSATEVARNLGRSRESISARKVILGVPGRFSRCSQKVIQIIREKPTTASQSKQNRGNIFEIEEGYEVPSRFSRNAEEKSRIQNTFELLRPGQSFVIEGNLVHVARQIAKDNFESYKIKIVSTDADKKFARVYRIL